MFKLLRYFSIASLLAFIVVTVLLGIFYRQMAVRGLIRVEESKNVALTQAFVNSLWSDLEPFIRSAQTMTDAELITHPDSSHLRQAVVAQMRDLSVVKVKLYDLDGRAIFSTETAQIGGDDSGNAGFLDARTGVVASELTHRDSFSAFEGTIEDQDVLSTYIPIRQPGMTEPIEGVFELYSNVTPLLQYVDTMQRNIVAGVALILSALYIMLFLIVRRADGIIRHQHQEQLQTQENLRQQQHANAVLKERERLARELHDSLGQVLGYVNVQAQAVRELLTTGYKDKAENALARLIDVVQNAHVDVREHILNLHTDVVTSQNIITALEEYLAQFRTLSDIQTEFVASEKTENLKLAPTVEAQLIRIVQEALTNVRKHSQAQHAKVSLTIHDNEAQITIEDDGQGFSPTQLERQNGRHFGLKIMRDRAIEVGGSLQVKSAPGTGATVMIKVPLAL